MMPERNPLQDGADQATQQLQALSAPPAFIVDPDLAFVEPLPIRLLQTWQAKCAGRVLPARGDFDPAALRPHLGWLCIVDLPPGIDELRYRLIGSRIADFVGRDMTGRLVSEVLPAPALAIYHHLMIQPRPLRTHGRVEWRDKGHIPHETLILPLAGDGRTVDGFLVEMVFPDWMPGARI